MNAITVGIDGVAAMLDVHVSVVREWDDNNEMPKPITLNGCKRWAVRDIKRWVEAQRELVSA